MTNHDDPTIRKALSGHVPERTEIDPDWESVLEREQLLRFDQPKRERHRFGWLRVPGASRTGARRRISRRVLVVTFAATVALVGSTIAVASEMGWWPADEMPIAYPDNTGSVEYLDSGRVVIYSGKPASDVATVSIGDWNGKSWYVFVYRSVGNEIDPRGQVCYGIANGALPPSAAPISEVQSAFPGCSEIRELDPELTSTLRLTTPVDSMSSGQRLPGQEESPPPYLFGPVVDEAQRVVIELMGGDTIETETLALPDAMGVPMRFFVAKLPSDADILNVQALAADGTRVAQSSNLWSYEDSPRPACMLSATCPPETDEGSGDSSDGDTSPNDYESESPTGPGSTHSPSTAP